MRVGAKEAAAILGIPAHQISRLKDDVIKRYKLTRKTHVYEVDSLYAYLDKCQSKPLQKPDASAYGGRSSVLSTASVTARPKFSLRELVRQARTR